MSQQSHRYRTNRDLFSNHYLTEHLRQTEPWKEVDEAEIREAYDEINELWEDKQDRVEDYNEAQLERNFIRPVFDILGIPFEIEETVMRNARRPDYGFFPSTEAADAAFDRDDFYEEAIAVADAKRWGRKLDTRGEEKRDFENPSYQIHAYLQETPPQWAVLTNGKEWRIYYGPTSHRLDSYYEIDLPELFEFVEGEGGIENFKDFYLFFRQQAFRPDRSGDCFLDDVYDESSVFAEAIGEDLQNNIYEAIRVLAEGFLDTNDDLDEDDLPLIHDSSLIYLYRLIFVLYAESEGRDLLPTDNDIYSASYSLNELKQTVADNRDETQQHYQTFQTHLWDRLEELFVLIDQGSQGKNIPKDQLYIPAYNGGLFRTNPDPDDSAEAQFLANHEADDAHLAEVIDLLTRRDADEGDGQVFVDYSSLDERHLGSIYEGLLEYKLDVADEPLTVEDEEYTPAGGSDEVEVEEGDVYLRTDAGERKATGSYYTPEYVVEHIVDEALGPLVDGIREDLVGYESYHEGGFAEEFAERVFELKVLDPAMGSGHFLVNAVDYLAREIIDAQERQDQQAVKRGNNEEVSDPRTEDGELRDINWARRKVAQRCIYGVDLNPLATELAKVSLWLRTLAAEQPLAFLDHHLKTGNSLIGSDIEDIEELESVGGGSGQNTSLADFGVARKGTIEQLMKIYQDFVAIENRDLADVKEMEAKYSKFERNELRRRLESVANVHTADHFGLKEIPDDAYESMAVALDDDDVWDNIQQSSWFQTAQQWAEKSRYFHWRLEFPEVFYNEDGMSDENPGFDAIVGNPPYVIFKMLSVDIRDYYDQEFDSFVMKGDVYILFMELATDLLRSQGITGYIVQNKFTKANYGEKIRGKISGEETILQLINFNDSPVFDITAYPLVLIRKNETPAEDHTFEWQEIKEDDPDQIEDAIRQNELSWPIKQKDLSEGIWHQFVSEEGLSADTVQLGEFADQIGEGAASGARDVYVVDEETIETYNLEKEFIKPVLRGGDVGKYRISEDDLSYLIYPYEINDGVQELVNESEIPNIICYLKEHEDDLISRRNFGKRLVDQGYEWYEFKHAPEGVSKPKILFPDISPENRFAYDETGEKFCLNTIYYLVRNDTLKNYDSNYLISVLNSNFLDYLFKSMSPKVRGGYLRYKSQYVSQLPIPAIDFRTPTSEREDRVSSLVDEYNAYIEGDGTLPLPDENGVAHDFLTELADRMAHLQEERAAFNLGLLDYLGIPANELPDSIAGKALDEIYIPVPDIADAPLSKTTEEFDGLRVESVSFETNNSHTVMSVDISYKPDDDDTRETDTYGRLVDEEFETYEAMRFTSLSDVEETLVRSFVPIAVEKSGGFAGFRQTATKTNTLLDRLEKLTLPDANKVQDGLEKYFERKNQADKLDEKIELTDQLIDQIVYNLFGLSNEEQEIVEEDIESGEVS
ncbi:Eco57I restriction-modification methylase domain-containing protein [Salinigranum halophilum]|uniref:Eco57I restriction-modification methylase domain-containing protein n=1 Tax=Salinigranum halophilum TaxID=2565931 RepID=UPI0010A9401A|nr:TaqI-like C-terminal specificity domain-containing protein [Salinigranum halophilum]